MSSKKWAAVWMSFTAMSPPATSTPCNASPPTRTIPKPPSPPHTSIPPQGSPEDHCALTHSPATPDHTKEILRTADIHAHPHTKYFSPSHRAEMTIAIFSTDPATGLFKTIAYPPTMGKEPRNFTLDP